ncbi:MAG: 3-isopropylmalate dehydrogenase [Deltaproteobacteria bacterium HGW-Deltaproteobacteria-7]|jgi:3-isopropylmalate dehydrogenase|nr:MAG: 3-isopropylmalate dehydrogenase [Deltaproteobacteria bacterium HGW-Deltaproteobacteria-7]PKN51050.1 MAG: 3-isopropylmalate dehydrogenase [Deltaproteobacteria bacterium HGW-Deltaproteobacteria-13]
MKQNNYNIAVFAGDGIGPEIIKEALKILKIIAEKKKLNLQLHEGLAGGCAYDRFGVPLPDASLELALQSDAVLLGAVGGPQWESLDYKVRPERALLALREKLGIFANLRPVVVFEELLEASPLKKNIVQGIDIMIVRELTGDVYFGKPRGVKKGKDGKRYGVNTMVYSEDEIRRIAVRAFEIARTRKKNLLSVDKANVLECTELWRNVVTEVGQNYPDITLKHMYVDNCAMQLIRNPAQFDVIVTSNLFGDILSDEAAMLTGSIGMLPSASLGEKKALYEPIHGSAPDIAGKNIANPLATILSAALMLRYSFSMQPEAELIEKAVAETLKEGFRTQDIHQPGTKLISTEAMGDAVAKNVRNLLN